jgi:hypothetical protein
MLHVILIESLRFNEIFSEQKTIIFFIVGRKFLMKNVVRVYAQ